MISNERLDQLYAVPVGSVDINELVEISSVAINRRLPKEMRILKYIEEIKNPYCFKVGNSVVKTQYSNSGLTLQNALAKTTER